MFRRPRRSGINFIDNEKNRNLTYFKRRSGLIKSSADLSTLTGGMSAIVLESESGKISAFGTPSANVIIDSFLSENNPYIDEGEKAKIPHMQDELFRLEKDMAVEGKRAKETKNRLETIKNTSRIDQLLSSDEEDLGADNLSELFQSITRVREEYFSDQANLDMQQEEPSQHSQSSWAPLPHSTSPHSTLPHQTSFPSTQVLHHQAHIMPPVTNEADQNNPYFPQPQPPLLPVQAELAFNPMAPPDPNHAYTNNFSLNPVAPPYQNHAYAHNFNDNSVVLPDQDHAFHSFNYNSVGPSLDHATNSHNFDGSQQSDSYQWDPFTPFIEPYYEPSLHPLNDYFGLADDYEGQSDDDGLPMNLFGSPFLGESFGDGA